MYLCHPPLYNLTGYFLAQKVTLSLTKSGSEWLLRSTRLNCIFHDLFKDTPLDHIWRAEIRAQIWPNMVWKRSCKMQFRLVHLVPIGPPGSYDQISFLARSPHCNYNVKLQSSGQRESFFQSRDENESFSDSISFIETRPRIPDTYSQASRRDREKISSNLGQRDEIEIYYLHSQTSRREQEFPWSDLGFRDENDNSKSCHLSLNSGLNGLTILHAISERLLYKMQGIWLDVLPFWSDPVMFRLEICETNLHDPIFA